jgi:hypothetical protein
VGNAIYEVNKKGAKRLELKDEEKQEWFYIAIDQFLCW